MSYMNQADLREMNIVLFFDFDQFLLAWNRTLSSARIDYNNIGVAP